MSRFIQLPPPPQAQTADDPRRRLQYINTDLVIRIEATDIADECRVWFVGQRVDRLVSGKCGLHELCGAGGPTEHRGTRDTIRTAAALDDHIVADVLRARRRGDRLHPGPVMTQNVHRSVYVYVFGVYAGPSACRAPSCKCLAVYVLSGWGEIRTRERPHGRHTLSRRQTYSAPTRKVCV